MKGLKRGSALGHAFLIGLAAIPLVSFAPSPFHADLRPEHSAVMSVQPNLGVFEEGERLEYEVSYLTIKLGSIVTRVLDVDTTRTGILFKTDCLIRSYKGVPFVTLHTRFQSTISDSISSVSFSTKEWIADTTHKYINYLYARKTGTLYISERIGNRPVPENYDTLALEGKRWQDGLSLFFFARAFAHLHGRIGVAGSSTSE